MGTQLSDLGFSDTTEFRHIEHNPPPFYFVNSYLTLFNHAGPHIDAPNHIARGAKGIDEFPLRTFIGPLRLFDFRNKPKDQPLARAEFEDKNIRPGDIVIAFVGYMAPTAPDELPSFASLGPEAAEYLANIPVRMFGTDAFGVGPAHPAFLSSDIPVVEQLVGLEQVVGKRSPVFVGFPVMQWLVLRKRLRWAMWWVFATLVGYALVSIVAVWLVPDSDVVFIAPLLVGFLPGISQWYILRQEIPRAGRWVLASAIGWVPGTVLGLSPPLLLAFVAADHWTGEAISNWASRGTSDIAGFGLLFLVAPLVTGAALSGLVTGFTLHVLLQGSSNREMENRHNQMPG